MLQVWVKLLEIILSNNIRWCEALSFDNACKPTSECPGRNVDKGEISCIGSYYPNIKLLLVLQIKGSSKKVLFFLLIYWAKGSQVE